MYYEGKHCLVPFENISYIYGQFVYFRNNKDSIRLLEEEIDDFKAKYKTYIKQKNIFHNPYAMPKIYPTTPLYDPILGPTAGVSDCSTDVSYPDFP